MDRSEVEDVVARLGRAQAPADAEAWLDARDRPEFDDEWVRVHRALSSVRPPGWLAKAREQAHRSVLALTGEDDVAASVSDDVDLLGLAVHVGLEDPWLQGLFDTYAAGELPS